MNREVHVPFCERLRGKFPQSTHQYHRAIKQVCNIEHFQVRGRQAIKNHLFAAICGFVQLQRLRAMDLISNCYRLQRDLFNQAIASFIAGFMPSMAHVNPQFQSRVNA